MHETRTLVRARWHNLVRAYRYGIEDNQRINARTSRLFDGALALLILGLQLLISMAIGLTALMQRGG